jgi:hypothetical protein
VKQQSGQITVEDAKWLMQKIADWPLPDADKLFRIFGFALTVVAKPTRKKPRKKARVRK